MEQGTIHSIEDGIEEKPISVKLKSLRARFEAVAREHNFKWTPLIALAVKIMLPIWEREGIISRPKGYRELEAAMALPPRRAKTPAKRRAPAKAKRK